MRKLNMLIVSFLLTGCGGATKNSTTPPPPAPQNAVVNGQYTVVTTSTKGAGTINIYTNFSTSGTSFTGTPNTLACPNNDLLKCSGNTPPLVTFFPTGTISGNNIQMLLTFPNTAGNDTITFIGTASGTNISGTYTDSQNDSGTWTATQVSSFSGNYTGTLKPNSNPTIAPGITLVLTQDASLKLTGAATVTNSSCFTSLNFTGGEAIGGAFTLTNSNPNILIIALPTNPGYIFQYNVGAVGACSGDFGRGTVSKN